MARTLGRRLFIGVLSSLFAATGRVMGALLRTILPNLNEERAVVPRRPVLLLLAVLAARPDGRPAAERSGKPNVIVIVTDDHGYADVGFQGSRDILTPHLDALAREGVICTNGYVTSAICTSSRAGLITGIYQQRTGFHDNAWDARAGLSPKFTTIADVLTAGGYATEAIGKWHLGSLPQFRPLKRGFSDHYGFLGGGRSFFPNAESQNVPFVPKDPDQIDLWRNENRTDDPAYLTDAFGDEAVRYIRGHKDQPFFVYLAFNAPHVPLQATEKYLSRFSDLKGARRIYAAMISAADDAIGRVNNALREEDLEENTLIFFFSDNGGHPRASQASNAPLRGEKGTVYEGGIRVPFVVKWPEKIPAGKTYDQPVISLDVMATALAAADLDPPAGQSLDGVDLVPYLSRNKDGCPHETLYWRYIDHRAIRHGQWKLTMPSDGPEGLYNLSRDISESTDLSAEHPEILKDLKDRWAKWNAQMPPVEKLVPRRPS